MKQLQHILNRLRINCWLSKHEWVELTEVKICNRCTAVIVKDKRYQTKQIKSVPKNNIQERLLEIKAKLHAQNQLLLEAKNALIEANERLNKANNK